MGRRGGTNERMVHDGLRHGSRRRVVLITVAMVTALLASAQPASAATLQFVGWGHNWYGQAKAVPDVSRDITAVAGGRAHNLALTTAGRVRAWGLNQDGQTNTASEMSWDH